MHLQRKNSPTSLCRGLTFCLAGLFCCGWFGGSAALHRVSRVFQVYSFKHENLDHKMYILFQKTDHPNTEKSPGRTCSRIHEQCYSSGIEESRKCDRSKYVFNFQITVHTYLPAMRTNVVDANHAFKITLTCTLYSL